MSKFTSNLFKVAAYPTFRLYTEPKKFVEFKEKELTEKTFRKWMVDQDVENFTEVEEKKKEEKKDEKKEEKKEEKKTCTS